MLTVNPLRIFIHHPKTGGSSLMVSLGYPAYDDKNHTGKYIGFDVRTNRGEIDRFLGYISRMSPLKRDRVEVVRGHLPYGLHNYFPERNPIYFSMLRDPKERLISKYRFVLLKRNNPYHRIVKSKNMSLADFLRSGLSPLNDNCYARLFSGLYQTGYGACDNRILDTALENMQNIFVGILDKFAISLSYISNRIGVDVDSIAHVNKNDDIEYDVTDEDENVIMEYTKLDYAIYDEACRKLCASE